MTWKYTYIWKLLNFARIFCSTLYFMLVCRLLSKFFLSEFYTCLQMLVCVCVYVCFFIRIYFLHKLSNNVWMAEYFLQNCMNSSYKQKQMKLFWRERVFPFLETKQREIPLFSRSPKTLWGHSLANIYLCVCVGACKGFLSSLEVCLCWLI